MLKQLSFSKKISHLFLSRDALSSLRSKRFRRAFRPLEALSAFWLRKNWGERNTDGSSGEGERRREKETLARKPHDFEKSPFDTFAVG